MNEFTEWDYASVDLSNDITTIASVPCLVKGYHVTTVLSAHACPIKDGTTTALSVPASSAVGASLDLGDPIFFRDSLVVDPDNAATGALTVVYRIANGDRA